MIYRQHNVAEAAPAMTETAFRPVGSSSSFCSAAVAAAVALADAAAEVTVAASSGFC